MALKDMDARCTGCGHHFRAKPQRSFLGFLRLQCPQCARRLDYPLTRGYRVTYWLVLALMTWVFINNLADGKITFPGLLDIGVILALVGDHRIRRTLAASAASSDQAGAAQ